MKVHILKIRFARILMANVASIVMSVFMFVAFASWGSSLKPKRKPNEVPPKPVVELLSIQEFSGDLEFEETRVGGLSGIVWDSTQNLFWVVSDDRGRINEPRVYGFQLNVTPTSATKSKSSGKSANPPTTLTLDWKLQKVVLLKESKADVKKKKAVLDLEGISLLPWGHWLMVSEGDMNQKPRAQSRLMEFKLNGEWVRDYNLPEDYGAEKTGQQKKGPRNNFSFEALAQAGTESRWVIGTELGLLQDSGEKTRLLEFTQTEAWVLKPGREWFYPLAPIKQGEQIGTEDSSVRVAASSGVTSAKPSAQQATQKMAQPLITGLSEILHVQNDVWWVLERSADLSLQGLGFQAEIYSVQLNSSQELQKELQVSLNAVDPRLEKNFEAMAWGPDLPDGRKLLVLVSDNNLEKSQTTVFATFGVKLPVVIEPEEF